MRPGSGVLRFQDLIPGSPKFSEDFNGQAYCNVLKVFDICLELPSDLEKYLGFVVDKFFLSLCILENRSLLRRCKQGRGREARTREKMGDWGLRGLRNSQCLWHLFVCMWLDPPVRNAQNLDGSSHSNENLV